MSQDSKLHDYCIIGGGVSGLACAERLTRQHPGASICVLEAAERLGGRIRHAQMAVVRPNGQNNDEKESYTIDVDCGAQFLHGYEIKPGITRSKDPFFENLLRSLDIPMDGFSVDDEKAMDEGVPMSEREKMLITTVVSRFEQYGRSFYWNPRNSAAVTLKQWLLDYEYNDVAEFKENKEKFLEDLCSVGEKMICRANCTDIDKLLINHYMHKLLKWKYNSNNLFLKGSMIKVIDHFVDQISGPDLNVDVHLNHPVTKVSLKPDVTDDESKSDICLIECQEENVLFTAKKVICSVPVTMLQSRFIEFDPPLDENVMKTIDSLYMGPSLIIRLQLDRQIWPEKGNSCFFMESDLFSIGFCEKRRVNDEFDVYIAVVYLMGSDYEKGSSMTEEELIGLAMNELRGFYNQEFECLTTHMFDWMKMPFVKGAYVSTPLDPSVTLADVDALRQPLWDGAMLFAGEMVSESTICVQEAILAGYGTAERALPAELRTRAFRCHIL